MKPNNQLMRTCAFLKSKYGIDIIKEFPRKTKVPSRKFITRDLDIIKVDFEKKAHLYDAPANYLASVLSSIPQVHAVKHRVKKPDHLIRKIIRRRIKKGVEYANLGNYLVKIKDIIGLRILHLFKEEWAEIDKSIQKIFNVVGTPIAYVTTGERPDIIDLYKSNGCKIVLREKYRSIHYKILFAPTKSVDHIFFAEIQIRTLFDEACGEVDHRCIYPNNEENELFLQNIYKISELSQRADLYGSMLMHQFALQQEPGSLLEHKKHRKYVDNIVHCLALQLEGEGPVKPFTQEDLVKRK
ncbi:MAG TPA: RelA/SpoT domain-containing protein [Chitinivibrionales bacterium]|nr:RelA/SpoT domain-containing protein [Chitinivibrionales bacterium]